MTPNDLGYVRDLLARGKILAPVLELGTGYGGDTCREVITGAGLKYYGSDMSPAPGVDFVADFERRGTLTTFDAVKPFGTVLAMNVLEHTFDPVTVLDNAFSLTRPGGNVVALAPAVWPLHSYPFDAYRLLPNFYETYAKRRNVILNPDDLVYVAVGPVADHRWPSGEYRFPDLHRGPAHALLSRVVHRVFRTSGRGLVFRNHIAVAAVLTKPAGAG